MKAAVGCAWFLLLGAACGGRAQTGVNRAEWQPIASTPAPSGASQGKAVPPSDSQNPLVAERFEQYRKQFADLEYEGLAQELRVGEPRKAPLGFDPKTARYYREVVVGLGLTRDEERTLDTVGFVSLDPARPESMASAYHDIYTRDLPVLVTTDSILDALHRSFDAIIKDLELRVFAPTLDAVLTGTQAVVKKRLDEHPPASVATSLGDVDEYLTVARNLLAGAGAPPFDPRTPASLRKPDVGIVVKSLAGRDAEVAATLRAISTTRLEQDTRTELRGGHREIDYSQFIPRGHYTETKELKRYFRAMIWIGRADTGFFLSEPAPDSGITVDVARERRGAAVLARALAESGGMKQLATMGDLIDFLVGSADNLDPTTLHAALRNAGLASLSDFDDDARIAAVCASLAPTIRQQILSQRVLAPEDSTRAGEPPGLFQLFGQRFAIDSFVESKVVYDSIYFRGERVGRELPSGLDVMAALGSQEAVRLLEPELRKYNYAANLLASAKVVDDIAPEGWNRNVYGRWIDALRVLDDVPAEPNRFPTVMKSEAWERKQLRTALASWAELRHDTLLYSKQSYGDVKACEYPDGFVEPYPDFFEKVGDLARAAADRVGKLDLSFSDPKRAAAATRLRDGQTKFFRHFESTTAFLAAVARKELASQPLTDAERVFLKATIDQRGGSGPPRYDGWYPTLIYGDGKAVFQPTIADVHTYPGDVTSPKVLEVGTGRTNYVVAVIDNEQDRAVYVGPAFSYFEFSVPPEQRLTDEAWTNLVYQNANAQKPPDWERMFQMPARVLGAAISQRHDFPMTPDQKAAYEEARRQYFQVTRARPLKQTPAERLRYDKRLDELRRKMFDAFGCGCPPNDAECPCLPSRE